MDQSEIVPTDQKENTNPTSMTGTASRWLTLQVGSIATGILKSELAGRRKTRQLHSQLFIKIHRRDAKTLGVQSED